MQKWEVCFFTELTALRLYQLLKLRQDVFVLEQTCLYADLDKPIPISKVGSEYQAT